MCIFKSVCVICYCLNSICGYKYWFLKMFDSYRFKPDTLTVSICTPLTPKCIFSNTKISLSSFDMTNGAVKMASRHWQVSPWQIDACLTCLAFSSMTVILLCADLNSEYMEMGFRGAGGMGSTSRTKRMRTSFKHHQLRTMKSYFAINHNPDAKDLKQLSQKTGLPKRVLQVIWRFRLDFECICLFLPMSMDFTKVLGMSPPRTILKFFLYY